MPMATHGLNRMNTQMYVGIALCMPAQCLVFGNPVFLFG